MTTFNSPKANRMNCWDAFRSARVNPVKRLKKPSRKPCREGKGLIPNGKSNSGRPLPVSRLNASVLRKRKYVRNCFSDSACSDVARRHSYLAAQPELGLLPERRAGRGPGNPGCPASARQDLTRRCADSDARASSELLYGVLAASFGGGPRAAHKDHHHRWQNERS